MTPETYGMPVTRFEITELVGDSFDGGASSRDELVGAARHRGARSAVLLLLRRLPERRYERLADIWRELPELPDAHDPWEDGLSDPRQS